MGFHRKAGGSGGITPEMFGCTKMVIDKITFSENKTGSSSHTLNHSLGEVPSVYILAADVTNINIGSIVAIEGFAAFVDADKTTTKGTTRIYIGSTGKHSYYVANLGATVTDKTVDIMSNSGYCLIAGIEYNLITMK